MTTAIYYHPDAYTTGPKLMGRNAAGESFLRAFLTYSKSGEFWVQVYQPEHAGQFVETARSFGRNETVKAVDNRNLGALRNAGSVYFPGPGIGGHAWNRANYGHDAWSLCGITHTTSSASVMDSIAELLTAPVQPWDALICTSTAVKDNVTRVLQAQLDYLQQRLGVRKLVLPKVPVIPLGIHTQDFVFSEQQKSAARTVLGADDNTLVTLFMGRLSFHAKAHPLAMYQALERAGKSLPEGKKLILVECGWHANAPIAQAFKEAAHIACPSVRVITLDGRDAENRQIAWAGADVFCSLSDNIQESFGITPIEAMAAGLPVVVSDWDGYKDTVRADIDGFRIPTWMPEAGLGRDLALRHALELDSYDMYCGHTCSLVAVDVEAAAQAFAKLFAEPELRRQMGKAGRQRAREVFDWSAIIPRYEALWAELAEIRRVEGGKQERLQHPWPARIDPFHAYAGYPTKTLLPQSVLALSDSDVDLMRQRLQNYRALAMVNFAAMVLPNEAEAQTLLDAMANGPQKVADLLRFVPPERRAFVSRSLVWLLKLGILKVCP